MDENGRNLRGQGSDMDQSRRRVAKDGGPELRNENVRQTKKKDSSNEFYIGIFILGAIFIFGFVCGRWSKTYDIEQAVQSSNVQEVISLLRQKNEETPFQSTDVENLQKLVEEVIQSPSSQAKGPDSVSKMSHKEAMEKLSEYTNPNATRDFIFSKIYEFFFIVAVIVFLIFWIFLTKS